MVLNAYCSLAPASVEEALTACRTVRAASLTEPGCEKYDFYQSPDDATKIVFVEEWTSKAHLDTHFEQDAFKTFFATLGPLLSGPPDIRIFESTKLEG